MRTPISPFKKPAVPAALRPMKLPSMTVLVAIGPEITICDLAKRLMTRPRTVQSAASIIRPLADDPANDPSISMSRTASLPCTYLATFEHGAGLLAQGLWV